VTPVFGSEPEQPQESWANVNRAGFRREWPEQVPTLEDGVSLHI
jgi:hypothetical protein